MNAVHFGLNITAGARSADHRAHYMDYLNRCLGLIEGKFDSAWIIDHLDDGENDLLECLTTLAYVSALHPAFRFGSTVVCQSFRNPALLAKMAATEQFLSGGRFTLGIGAGWNEPEYTAYGYPFPPASERVAQLEEAVQIIRAPSSTRASRPSCSTFRITPAWKASGCSSTRSSPPLLIRGEPDGRVKRAQRDFFHPQGKDHIKITPLQPRA